MTYLKEEREITIRKTNKRNYRSLAKNVKKLQKMDGGNFKLLLVMACFK